MDDSGDEISGFEDELQGTSSSFIVYKYFNLHSAGFAVADGEDLGGARSRSLYRWEDLERSEETAEQLEMVARSIRERAVAQSIRERAVARGVREHTVAPSTHSYPDEPAYPTPQDPGVWRVRVHVCTLFSYHFLANIPL